MKGAGGLAAQALALFVQGACGHLLPPPLPPLFALVLDTQPQAAICQEKSACPQADSLGVSGQVGCPEAWPEVRRSQVAQPPACCTSLGLSFPTGSSETTPLRLAVYHY